MQAQRGSGSIAVFIFNLNFRWKWVPGLLPGYPFYRSLAEPQVLCGWVSITENLFPQPGVDRRTLQALANRYTDYTIWGSCLKIISTEIISLYHDHHDHHDHHDLLRSIFSQLI